MENIQRWSSSSGRYVALAMLMPVLAGCQVVGDIFKAGAWTAIIGIGVVVLVGFGIASLVRR